MRRSVIGKHVRGFQHIRKGLPCQDSHYSVRLPGGICILSVADGHGSESCPHSDVGARLAARIFCRTMKDLLRGTGTPEACLQPEESIQIARTLDEAWKRQVQEWHRCHLGAGPVPVEQYGTTLLGLVITDRFAFAYQLGDGDICMVEDGETVRLTSPERLLGTDTHSLSRPASWEKAVTAFRPLSGSSSRLFSMTTDGFANSYPGDREFMEAIGGYAEALAGYGVPAVSAALPAWLAEISEAGSGDDVTMLLAWETEKTSEEEEMS